MPLTQVDGIVANTHELKERQETPDSPEALQCVPSLQLSDIPKTITKVRYMAWGGMAAALCLVLLMMLMLSHLGHCFCCV